MTRLDLIKTMDSKSLAEFILNFDDESVRSIMCKKCKYQKLDNQGKSHCNLLDNEPCAYSDEDMVQDWLEMEI